MRILFVCRFNRFRSRIAEGIFKKLNADDGVVCSSAGIEVDEERSYVCDNVLNIMKDRGYEVFGKSKLVSSLNLKDYNRIVVVADNVSEDDFGEFTENVSFWNVSDCGEENEECIEKAVNEIEDRVMDLLESLSWQ